ncbi:hypothetical protein DVH24_023579 [Malus domestica]|uniref:Uncharacterized protein n=1 Tax=Malus domestica TaxID=3750 RepID=A0A498I5E4_MALDO|nr:hypothetical protein DVH24_023579 [Malus domestica]
MASFAIKCRVWTRKEYETLCRAYRWVSEDSVRGVLKQVKVFGLVKTNEKGLKTLSFNDKDKIKGKVNSTRKTNENDLKTLSFNDKDKIKGKVNSTRIDFLV